MRIGVVGNGMIVKRFLEDTCHLEDVCLTALCVRTGSLETGEGLAARYDMELYIDYSEFLASDLFDTVYIGIVNSKHYEYAKKALLSGRNVICEKPFTVTVEETEELISLAKKNHLFLWEANKLPYGPILPAVAGALSEIGVLKMIQCNFSRISSRFNKYEEKEVLPTFDPAYAGGCLYDINVYNLHLVTMLFGEPKDMRFFCNKGYNGIDTSGTAILTYPSFYAVCTAAKDSSSPCSAVLQGTKGYIEIQGCISSASRAVLVNDSGECVLAIDENPGNLADETREFCREYTEGDFETCHMMLDQTLRVMKLLEKAREQAHIEFTCIEES